MSAELLHSKGPDVREREHWVVTIRLEVDEGVSVKDLANIAADRIADCGGNIQVYDVHVDEEVE